MAKRVLDLLADNLAKTSHPAHARKATLDQIGHELSHTLKHSELEDALDGMGLKKQLAPRIRAAAKGHGSHDLAMAAILVIDNEEGEASAIPTAECLSRHLPPDRDPTRDEIAAAIRACKAESK